MSFPLKYNLTVSELQIKVGAWAVRRIRYDDIESVSEGYEPWNEHWTNPWPWQFVTIRRKTGWIKNFVINPPDRTQFVEDLRSRIRSL